MIRIMIHSHPGRSQKDFNFRSIPGFGSRSFTPPPPFLFHFLREKLSIDAKNYIDKQASTPLWK